MSDHRECLKCNGTGTYTGGGLKTSLTQEERTCRACQGKGFTTPQDRERTKRYWAWRQSRYSNNR